MQVRNGISTHPIYWEKYDEPLTVVVVEHGDETLLFGGGLPSLADDLSALVDDYGVDVVVVEHGDPDHYGAVPRLRANHGVTVAAPRGDQDRLLDAGVDPDALLDGGETSWGVETISAPGHTPDNMAYLVDDVLIAGDTVVGADSYFAADDALSGRLSVMRPEFNEDDARTRTSVPTLLDYEFDAVLAAHGAAVPENGRQAVETLVDDLD